MATHSSIKGWSRILSIASRVCATRKKRRAVLVGEAIAMASQGCCGQHLRAGDSGRCLARGSALATDDSGPMPDRLGNDVLVVGGTPGWLGLALVSKFARDGRRCSDSAIVLRGLFECMYSSTFGDIVVTFQSQLRAFDVPEPL